MPGNVLLGNGGFANPTNGDLADATTAFPVDNCFTHNVDLASGKPTSDPANIQDLSVLGTCGVPGSGDTGMLFLQLAARRSTSAPWVVPTRSPRR